LRLEPRTGIQAGCRKTAAENSTGLFDLSPTTTPIVYTDVKDSGVLLTIRYLCKPHERRTTTEVIWEKVLQAFEQHQDIQLAYPTNQFFDGRLELRQSQISFPAPVLHHLTSCNHSREN